MRNLRLGAVSDGPGIIRRHVSRRLDVDEEERYLSDMEVWSE